jgi:hypothetical protein
VPDGTPIAELSGPPGAVSGTHLGTRGQHQGAVLRENDELFVLAPIAGG